MVFSCSLCILPVTLCMWGSTLEHLHALGGGTCALCEPQTPCFQDQGLNVSAGPAVILYPWRRSSTQMQTWDEFQLQLLRKCFYNKVIVLGFEHD